MKKGRSSATAIIVIVAVILIIVIGSIIYFSKKKSGTAGSNSNSAQENTNTATTATRDVISTPNADIIIFWGATCPHCKKVNDYIIANNIDKVVPLQHLEVYNDKANLQLMQQKLDQCKNLSADDKGGVPFLYSSETCIVGDQPIIDYLKGKVS